MPRQFFPTPNSHETMTRPICLDIARQLLRALELPEDTYILFPGDIGQTYQPGSVAEDNGTDPSRFRFLQDRFFIEITEKANEDYILATTVHQKDATPYFLDRGLGVELKPVYHHTTLEFSIVVRARSRDRAKRIRDQMLAKRAVGRETFLHEVSYSYCVPDLCMALLKKVHEYREAVAGYGDDFSSWVRKHITERATNLTNQTGSRSTLAIGEHQGEIMGWFDFPAVPDGPEKDHDAGTWNWNLNYVTNYDKVIGTAARWPISVHNQILPKPWVGGPYGHGSMIEPARRPNRAGRITRALREATGNYLHKNFDYARKIGGYIYPEFDDWSPDIVKPDTSTLFVSMMQVDLANPRFVCNLEDLGVYAIDSDVVALMKEAPQRLSKYLQSPILVDVYENELPLKDDLVKVDADLNVTVSYDLNPRHLYHLRISLVNTLMGLHAAAKKQLLSGSVGARKILLALQSMTIQKLYPVADRNLDKPPRSIKEYMDWLKGLGPTPPHPVLANDAVLVKDGPIPLEWYQEIAKEINRFRGIHYTGIEYTTPYVGFFNIVLHRRS